MVKRVVRTFAAFLGAKMMAATLDERMARVEHLVEELVRKSETPSPSKDWRRTVGMFDGDPVMKEIIEAGRRIREEDRRQAPS